MAFLEPLEGGLDLFGRAIATDPEAELPAAGRLQLGELDRHRGDRRRGLPGPQPGADQSEQLGLARERVAHQRPPLLSGFVLDPEANPHPLGARPAQAELHSQIATQRAADEEERLPLLDRLLELPRCDRAAGRRPGFNSIRLETGRSFGREPASASQLGFQPARSDGGNRAEGPQTEKVEAIELPGLELEGRGGKRREEAGGVGDMDRPARPGLERRDTRCERPRPETQSGFGAGRFSQPAPHFTERQTGLYHALQLDPGGALETGFDAWGKVVERGTDELPQPVRAGRIWVQQLRIGTELLSLALAHAGPDASLSRLS